MPRQALAVKDHAANAAIPTVTQAQQKMKHDEQVVMLDASNKEFVPLPEGFQAFLRVEGFTPEYEEHIRVITNPNGRRNAAYDPEKERSMPVQDKLVRVWGWFHGNTGFSAMFKWASGRQDAYVVLDNPNPAPEALENQKAQIAAFRAHINHAKENANARIN